MLLLHFFLYRKALSLIVYYVCCPSRQQLRYTPVVPNTFTEKFFDSYVVYNLLWSRVFVVSLLINGNGSLRLMWALWWLVDPVMSTWALWCGSWMHKISLALFISLTIELWFQRRSVVFTMSMWNCLGVLGRLWQHVVFWTWWRHFVVALSRSLSYRMPFYHACYIPRCSCHWCMYIARLFRWSFWLWCSEILSVFSKFSI
jgi:hypothetical protein